MSLGRSSSGSGDFARRVGSYKFNLEDWYNSKATAAENSRTSSGNSSKIRVDMTASPDIAIEDTATASSLRSVESTFSTLFSTYNSRWISLWLRGLPAGQAFDKGRPTDVLLRLLSNGNLNMAGKRVVVPGCGRGYDVIEFARAGSLVTGIDVAPQAVEQAMLYATKCCLPEEVGARISFVNGDFLSHELEEAYTVGWDYYFMSALHPSMRLQWALSWRRVLKRGGILATLMFPVDHDAAGGGPPFSVEVADYAQLLQPLGFECVHAEAVSPSLSLPGREGREVLALWRRL